MPAWQVPTIVEVGRALAGRGDAILGGDVIHDDGGKLDYYRGGMYCGNWYLDWKPSELSWVGYGAESVSVTVRYIEAYVRRTDCSFWFVPGCAAQETVVELAQRSF